MNSRQIAVATLVIAVEIVLPASVITWLWWNGVAITVASFFDNLIYLHTLPMQPIASALTHIGIAQTLAYNIAYWFMTACELAVGVMFFVLLYWILGPIYREGREIVQAEWDKP